MNSDDGWNELPDVVRARFNNRPPSVYTYAELDPHKCDDEKCTFIQPPFFPPNAEYSVQQSRIVERTLIHYGLPNVITDIMVDYLTSERMCIHEGCLFDCLDRHDNWCIAQVRCMIDNLHLQVHFAGFHDNAVETISLNHTHRFAPLYTHTYPPVKIQLLNHRTEIDYWLYTIVEPHWIQATVIKKDEKLYVYDEADRPCRAFNHEEFQFRIAPRGTFT